MCRGEQTAAGSDSLFFGQNEALNSRAGGCIPGALKEYWRREQDSNLRSFRSMVFKTFPASE